MSDFGVVNGKNAALGEMLSRLTDDGICVSGGFVSTADAISDFLHAARLMETINARFEACNVNDARTMTLVGAQIRH